MSGGFQPTPDQARAIASLEGQVCISAGAGSGKTRVLAERFARALAAVPEPEAGTRVDQVLTVTFTEKAAAEIAERVRRVLLENGQVGQARRIDEAWISTIHGLCSRLLRAHALEAGLDPEFGVIAQADAGLLAEEVLEQVLGEGLADGSCQGLVGAYGIEGAGVQVLDLYERLRALGAEPSDVVLQQPVEYADALAGALAWARVSLELLSPYPSGRNLEKVLASLQAAVDELGRLSSPEHAPSSPAESLAHAGEVLRALQRTPLRRDVGSAKEVVEERQAARRQVLDLAVRAVAAPLERELVALVATFGRRYSEAKDARAVLDYDDLQSKAVELLSGTGGPGARYRSLFRLVMIDEFQDTNEVQARLIELLTDGNLCTVGDERQSIYGFRYADVDVYRRHVERMTSEGALPVRLAENFRSHPHILGFVNAVFGAPHLFGAGFAKLGAGRVEPDPPVIPPGVPRISLDVVHAPRGTGAQARETEADAVARRLRGLADAGVPQGDMVVLMRAMTHVDEYATALDRHGLAPLIVAGGAFFGLPEVEAVRALLRTVANHRDDEALAAVLASGLGRLSDDGLTRLRMTAEAAPEPTTLWEAGEHAGFSAEDADAFGRLRGAVGRARRTEGRASVSEILLRACEELDYDLFLLARGGAGRGAFGNVLKVARMADEFERARAGGSGIQSFLGHLALKERFGERVAPAAAVDEHVDAVRLMSVHAAKGLEFPVVAVPELGRDLGSDRGSLVFEKDGRTPRVWLCLPASQGGDASERRSIDAAEARLVASGSEAEEERRLLYVACTRAREALVLAGSADLSKDPGERPLGWVRTALGIDAPEPAGGTIAAGGAEVEVVRLEAGEPAPPPPAPRPRVRATAEGECDSRVRPAPAAGAAERLTTPPGVSHSAMRIYRRCPMRYYTQHVARLGDGRLPVPDDPMRLGDAVHAALRLLPLEGHAVPAGRIAAIARYHGLPPALQDRLERAVAGFAESAAWARMRGRGRPAREVAFAVPLDGCLLTGRMDLVSRVGPDVIVVDYKTGESAASSAHEDEYRSQADCYALAALDGGAERVEVVFVGVETQTATASVQAREMSLHYAGTDRARLRDELSQRAAPLLAGPYPHLERYDSGNCDGCAAAGGACPVSVPTARGPRSDRE